MSKYNTIINSRNTHMQSLAIVRNGLMVLALIAFSIQLCVNFSLENVVSNVLTLSTTLISCLIIFQTLNSSIGRAFVATLVFLMIISNSLLTVLGTLIEGNSLVENLQEPIQTYFHRFIFSVILLLSLLLSGSSLLLPIKYGLSKVGSIVETNLQVGSKGVWAFGIIATFGILISHLPLPTSLEKFLAGFQFFMYAPFILVVAPYNVISKAWQKKALLIYYIVLAGISLAGNSRFGMVAPLAVIAATWLLSVLLGYIVVGKKMIRKFSFIFIVGLFLSTQFIDLSTAILIAREGRDDRAQVEQLSYTWEIFLNKEALYEHRLKEFELVEIQGVNSDAWQENYISNPFLARFILTKFDDNCFVRINQFENTQKQILLESSIEKNLSQFPTFFLDFLDIKINKNEVNSYSMGDLIHNLATGHMLGSFVVGSIPAHSFAVLGWFYPVVLLVIYTLIFTLFNGVLSIINRNGFYVEQYSTLALILPFYVFSVITVDGLYVPINMLIRGIWQIILIYWVLIWLCRLFGIIGLQRNS